MNQDVMWTPWNGPGLEHLHLWQENNRIIADSIVIGVEDAAPFRVQYYIECEIVWVARRMVVSILDAVNPRSIVLNADGKGNWESEPGQGHIAALDGCIDVDLPVTPFTNTLPIRRLGLKPGEWRDLVVAYVVLPGLTIERVTQRYTCLKDDASGGLYRYEGFPAGFSADLPVDNNGLVLDYPGLFRRVWSAPRSGLPSMVNVT